MKHIIHRKHSVWLSMAVTLSGVSSASFANDAAAWGRVIQGVNQVMQQQEWRERKAEAERQRQEGEAQRRQAQESTQRAAEADQQNMQRQQAAETAQVSQAARTDALRPPGRYAGRLVLHRALLQSGAGTPPSSTIIGRSGVALAPDGKTMAWVERNGDLVRWPAQKVLRSQSTADNVWFVSPTRLIAREAGFGGPAELLDLDGNSLHRWTMLRQLKPTAPGKPWIVIEGDGKRCLRVTAYGNDSEMLAQTDLTASPPPDCDARYLQGALDVLAVYPDAVAYYRGNELVRRVAHAGGSSEQAPRVSWVDSTPYALTSRWSIKWGEEGNDKESSVLWVPQTGTVACLFSKAFLHISALGDRLYRFSPAGELKLSDCSFTPLGSTSTHMVSGGDGVAAVTDSRSGEVILIDSAGKPALSIKSGFGRPPKQEGFDSHLISIRATGAANLLEVFTFGDENQLAKLYNTRTGALLSELPAPSTFGGWGQRISFDGNTKLWTTRLWHPALMYDAALSEFLAQATKGPYETTEIFRKRLAQKTLAYAMQVELTAYDADKGQLDVRYRGMKIRLHLPPEQAQLLEGRKVATITGQLQVVEADFVELTKPMLQLAEGRSHALQTMSCPESLAGLASRMPAYQSARLAMLRTQVLGTSIEDTLVRAKRSGFDRIAAIKASLTLAEQSDRDAEKWLGSGDAAQQNDVRRAATGSLPLRYDCSSKRGDAVCSYIEQRWRALAAREVAQAMACRED